MPEQWKPIPEYEDLYEISNLGRIRRTSDCRRARTGSFKRHQVIRDGYLRVGLVKDGLERKFLVHRLVLAAFVGSCPNGYEVNHRDGDKKNNATTNLEYLVPSDNQRHAYNLGLRVPCFGTRNGRYTQPERTARGARHSRATLTEEQVRQIRQAAISGATPTQIVRSLHLPCTPAAVDGILRRKSWAWLT